MKRIKELIVGIAFIAVVAAPLVVVAAPVTTHAFTPDTSCEGRLLGLPVWFRGLAVRDSGGDCVVASPNDVPGGLSGFIWKVALNVIEMAMVITGYVAFFFILYAGFLYLTNGSNPTIVERARVTIINATIGLAIALGAIGILNLVFRILG